MYSIPKVLPKEIQVCLESLAACLLFKCLHVASRQEAVIFAPNNIVLEPRFSCATPNRPLLQNPYDAKKALAKNSAQLTGSLIIGVKPLDPQLHNSIGRKAEDSQTAQQLGVASPLSKTVFGPGPRTPAPAYRPYHLQTIDGEKVTGIAQPSKSTLTKVLDFLFSA